MERASKRQNHLPSEVEASSKKVVFFHPDLGIGGAERLVIDAAVGLQRRGHKVTIFTSHRDPKHCFTEARDGTLDVRVRGNTIIPATLLGRFKILCSILRQIHLLCTITWSGELAQLEPSVFVLDQLSAGIPYLRWFWEDTKILFYCHFPDLLLVQNRKRWFKRIWRIAFDWIEGWSIRGADRIVVNSGFTKGVVEGIWPGLGGEDGVGVIYPCVDTRQKVEPNGNSEDGKGRGMWKGKEVLLSINRFEKKKNVALAIKAFGRLPATEKKNVRLVVAGGYDVRVPENDGCHRELETLAASLDLKSATAKNIVSAQAVPDDIEVLFLLSVPDQLKSSLLKTARLLIYTPSDEHFGIVPLEAMLAGVPVLAANSGGPLETVVDGETGWLRPSNDVDQWTEVLKEVLSKKNETALAQMGEKGKQRVKQEFSEAKMAARFDEELDATMKGPRQQATELGDVATALGVYLLTLTCIAVVIREGLRPQRPGTENSLWDYVTGGAIIAVALAADVGVTWKLMQNESAFM